MRRLVMLLTVILTLIASTTFAATVVRGKVVHTDGSTAYVNVVVTLAGGGRSGTVYTGADGMFYLENVNPGQYKLTLKTQRETRTVQVVAAPKPYTDLAPLKLQ
jgi:hypothetical protein